MNKSTSQSPVKERLFTLASLIVLLLLVLPGFFTVDVLVPFGFLGALVGASLYAMAHVGLLA